MKNVTITELARELSEFVNRATYRGEEFLIFRGGKPVAALSPVPAGVRVRDFSKVLGDLPSLAEGDAEAFSLDIAAAREIGNDELENPWPFS